MVLSIPADTGAWGASSTAVSGAGAARMTPSTSRHPRPPGADSADPRVSPHRARAARRPAEPVHGLARRARAEGDAAGHQGPGQLVDQAGRGAGQRPEHRRRPAVAGGCGPGPGRTQAPHQAARLVGGGDEHREGGRRARAGRRPRRGSLRSAGRPAGPPPGARAARPTISPTDRSPEGVPPRCGRGRTRSACHPEALARAQDPGSKEGPPPGGHAEVEPVGHGSQPAPGPDGGTRCSRPGPTRRPGRVAGTTRWPPGGGPGRRRPPHRPAGRRRARTAASRPAGRRPRGPPRRGPGRPGRRRSGRPPAPRPRPGRRCPRRQRRRSVGTAAPTRAPARSAGSLGRGPADHLGQHPEEGGVVVE